MKKIKIIALFAALLLLMGCNNRMVIKNAELKDVIPQFKEFAALHGYNITYANDQTGAYRVELGQVYIPYQSETTRQRATIATENLYSNPPLTSYEESTWRTIEAKDRYVLVAVMVRLAQRNNDVVLQVDSTENTGPTASQGALLRKYFRELGYEAEFE
ncbi:MAG: hypothetical protein LBQ83_05395 [Candidatus Margulisbacteria bacterium]|jgi:uncharacterized lipoprotein NlpE involved in copper resistance|nr:hypothetical protein [Candidatus Margulisiibacteriota bacterium]